MTTNSSILDCTRFALPPNSLNLCGPIDKSPELKNYLDNNFVDRGTLELLNGFSTLSPYLEFISGELNLRNKFDEQVVSAYWTGNISKKVNPRDYGNFVFEDLKYNKKISQKNKNFLIDSMNFGLTPTHAYHVLNIWSRTGNVYDTHSVETINACLIRSGEVLKINKTSVDLKMNLVKIKNNMLSYKESKIYNLSFEKNIIKKLKLNDLILTHWGMFVKKSNTSEVNILNSNIISTIDIINKTIQKYDSGHHLLGR